MVVQMAESKIWNWKLEDKMGFDDLLQNGSIKFLFQTRKMYSPN